MMKQPLNRLNRFGLIAASGLSVVAFATSASAGTLVDREISFLVDVSGSVDTSEYNLQIGGYINAFNNLGATTPFAANFIVWSGASEQAQVVPWTLIDGTAASAQAFATLISNALLPENTQRPFAGSTAPGSAINFAVPLFGLETGGPDNGFDSARQIIDVSGDGQENNGANTATARNNALLAGIEAINGLPILTDDPTLDVWYQNNIVGGTGSFLEVASNFADFETAVTKKIQREVVVQAPEPSSLATLVGVGVLGIGSLLKRRREDSYSVFK